MTREEMLAELKFLAGRRLRQCGMFANSSVSISPSDAAYDLVLAVLEDPRCRTLMHCLIEAEEIESTVG